MFPGGNPFVSFILGMVDVISIELFLASFISFIINSLLFYGSALEFLNLSVMKNSYLF